MRISSAAMVSRARLLPALDAIVERHHPEDDRADEDIVGESGDADEHDAVAHDSQNEDAEHGADYRAPAASQRRAADHHHGDYFELIAGATVGVGSRRADRA